MAEQLKIFAGARHQGWFSYYNTDPTLARMFAPDFCWDLNIHEDEASLDAMIALLRSENSSIEIGWYFSACTTVPDINDRGPNSARLTNEEISDPTWILSDTWSESQPYRNFLDITIKACRDAIIAKAFSLAAGKSCESVCFDNCYWNQQYPGASDPSAFSISQEDWFTASKLFYQEACTMSTSSGIDVMFNIATLSDEIAEAFEYTSGLGGDCLTEMSFHPSERDEASLAAELAGYEVVLQRDQKICLIPRYAVDEDFGLAAIDSLYGTYGNIWLVKAGTAEWNDLYVYNAEDATVPENSLPYMTRGLFRLYPYSEEIVSAGILSYLTRGILLNSIPELSPVYTLEASPSTILREYITSEGWFSKPDDDDEWPMYVHHMPDDKRHIESNAGAIYDTIPVVQTRLMLGPTIAYYGLQIKVRGKDFDEAWVKLHTLANNFDNVNNDQVTYQSDTYQIYTIVQTAPPTFIGLQDGVSRRKMLTLNIIMMLRQLI